MSENSGSGAGMGSEQAAAQARAEDRERRTVVARELHDSVCGDLTDLLIQIEIANRAHPSPELHLFAQELRGAQAKIRRLVVELRDDPVPELGEIDTEIQRLVATAVQHRFGQPSSRRRRS